VGRDRAGVVRAALAAACQETSVTRRGHEAQRGPQRGKGCARVRVYGSSWVKCFYEFH
jgi:hypothetical protein